MLYILRHWYKNTAAVFVFESGHQRQVYSQIHEIIFVSVSETRRRHNNSNNKICFESLVHL